MSAMRDITNFFNKRVSSESGSDSPMITAITGVTPNSSRVPRVSAQAARRTFLQPTTVISSSDGEDSEDSYTVETPPEAPIRERIKTTKGARKTATKRAPVARKRLRLSSSTPPPVSVSLRGLTKEQLVTLISEMCTRHSELEKEVRDLAPEPDLTAMEEKLEYLKRNIYKSFPWTKFGSSRDAFCYKRVATHLNAFKKECTDQVRTLMSSQLYLATINYALMAWGYVEDTPVWDNTSHNKSRDQCFSNLAVQCKNALKKSSFTREQYQDIESRIEEACEANDTIKPCLELVQSIIQKT